MVDKRSLFYRRKWLNRPGFQAGAHVIAEVERNDYSDGTTNYYHQLRIADCDRVVSFSLDDHSPEERSNTLFKLDTLVSTLIDFRHAVAKSFDAMDKNGD